LISENHSENQYAIQVFLHYKPSSPLSESSKTSKYVNGKESRLSELTTTKLLLDEMYAGLKEYFETLGYEVLTAQEAGLKSAKDRDIVEYAEKNSLILVTQDQKPAELAELLGVKFVLISNAMIAKVADAKIKEKYT
jgi:predicted nuclease of predicted toxin-antitoxin system